MYSLGNDPANDLADDFDALTAFIRLDFKFNVSVLAATT